MRRASSTSTGTVRKLVAVGIERLSSMKRASVAAGPRIGLSSAPAGASGAAAPLPSSALSTSSFVTRPRGPVPLIESRSTPSAPAMRAAIGVALVAPFPAVGVESARLAAAAGCTGPFPADAGRPSPAAMRHRTVPTATVESGSTRSSAIVPATGEGTSASTLSVEISTSGSSTATASPGLTFHSSTVPSATESPISGKATSTSSASAASGSAASGLAGPGATGPSPSTSISPSTAPTATVESGSAAILDSVPAAGAGTSASTLSVEISTSGSSASTRSPTCFSHPRTVPSVTDSPIWGMVICTVVARVAIPLVKGTP